MPETKVEAHQCHFCGDWVRDGIGVSDGRRHWLSDCRPDLVKHEPGPACTWHNLDTVGRANCYAYQDTDQMWTGKHEHFYPDGPM